MGLSRKPWELQTYWDFYYLILTPDLEIQLYLTKEKNILMSKELKTPKFFPHARTPALVSHLYNDSITLCGARLHQHQSSRGSETRTSGCYTCSPTSPKLPDMSLRLWKSSNLGWQTWRWCMILQHGTPQNQGQSHLPASRQSRRIDETLHLHSSSTPSPFLCGKDKTGLLK